MMIAMALLTLNATAQDAKNKKGLYKDFSAEEMATLKTKKMTLHLDLTDDQQKEIKALFLEAAKKKEKTRTERKEKKENETTLNKPSKDERYAMANNRLDQQIEMKKKIKNILTAEQYKKWESSLSEKSKGKQKRLQKGKINKRH